jgi:hypothetical protein
MFCDIGNAAQHSGKDKVGQGVHQTSVYQSRKTHRIEDCCLPDGGMHAVHCVLQRFGVEDIAATSLVL